MSENLNDWPKSIAVMHNKFGHREAVTKMDRSVLKKFLEFRIDFLQEELDEMRSADTPEAVVDALVDLCVVAVGTLDIFEIDAQRAWDVVYVANMAKEVGSNQNRPNEFSLPDLVKPEGWVPPSHEGNHGLLTAVFTMEETA